VDEFKNSVDNLKKSMENIDKDIKKLAVRIEDGENYG
jgi:prefoldin subunit 5